MLIGAWGITLFFAVHFYQNQEVYMKKYFALLLVTLLLVGMLSACAGNPASQQEAVKKISVVTTIFPEYDWVSQIVGDTGSVELKLLLDKGVDLHSYQPTADDLVRVASCDLFIYVGGESDEWVEDALAEATNKDMKVINLLEALGDSVKEEEVIEGMEAEEEEEGEEEPEYDEHVWLSLSNAQALCQVIADVLSEISPENAESYHANATAYCDRLSALDADYSEAVSAGTIDTLLFADRFPFRYLVDDYGLNYYAAFVGCSAETEASFETILFLANKIDKLGLHSILQIESADGRIAETVKQATTAGNQEILTMDSMQSTTLADIENGTTYLSVMEKNLEILKEALR